MSLSNWFIRLFVMAAFFTSSWGAHSLQAECVGHGESSLNPQGLRALYYDLRDMMNGNLARRYTHLEAKEFFDTYYWAVVDVCDRIERIDELEEDLNEAEEDALLDLLARLIQMGENMMHPESPVSLEQVYQELFEEDDIDWWDDDEFSE